MTERCLLRGKTSGRVDDNPESLVKRFKTHMETSMPVINLFDKCGMVRRVDANRSREEVAADAMEILKDIESLVCSKQSKRKPFKYAYQQRFPPYRIHSSCWRNQQLQSTKATYSC